MGRGSTQQRQPHQTQPAGITGNLPFRGESWNRVSLPSTIAVWEFGPFQRRSELLQDHCPHRVALFTVEAHFAADRDNSSDRF